jgi:hypothetical protein
MIKVAALDRPVLAAIRKRMDEALSAVGVEFGLRIVTGRATYSPTLATFKVEVATVGADGVAETREARDYREMAYAFGLDPAWLGKSFTYGGKPAEIVGLKPNARRFPVLVRQGERTFKFTADTIRNALGGNGEKGGAR